MFRLVTCPPPYLSYYNTSLDPLLDPLMDPVFGSHFESPFVSPFRSSVVSPFESSVVSPVGSLFVSPSEKPLFYAYGKNANLGNSISNMGMSVTGKC